MGYKFRLRDVRLGTTDPAGTFQYIATPEFVVEVVSVPNENNRGDKWHDCRSSVYTDPHQEGTRTTFRNVFRNEWFEVEGPPSKVARVLARECRDVANETSARLFGDNQ